MAALFVEPYLGPNSLSFPGGVAGGYPVVTDSTARTAAAQFTLGTVARDTAGNRYMYVQFSGTVAATDCVSGPLATMATTANTATGTPWAGVAHAAATTTQFGWILTNGVVSVKSGTVSANTAVCPKTTAGTVNSLAATDFPSRSAIALAADSGGVVTILLQ